MIVVVSDTSAICYLVLIEAIELLPQLYNQIFIPSIVQQELSNTRSPVIVQNWINNPPEWLIIQTVDISIEPDLEGIDVGEKAAIILAKNLGADLIILDDALGRKVAQNRGLRVTGLMGVLDEAAKQNLIDLPLIIARLQQTSFRVSSKLIQILLQSYTDRLNN